MAAAEHRRDRIVRLVAEIDATQAVVDVVRCRGRARCFAVQTQFFERRRSATRARRPGRPRLAHDLLQALGRGLERGLPVDFAPGAVLLDHRLQRRGRRCRSLRS